jgi:DNA-binding response OmpR family regulator
MASGERISGNPRMNEIVSGARIRTVAQENLRTIEASLLAALSSHIGQPMSREELSRQVWRCEYRGTTRTIDQTVATLRKKLKTTQRIVTVHRVGYAYQEAEADQPLLPKSLSANGARLC